MKSLVILSLLILSGCATTQYVTVCHQEGPKEVCHVEEAPQANLWDQRPVNSR